MTRRIFRSICLVALAVFVACVALIMGVMYSYYTDVQKNQLKMQTELAAQGFDHEGMAYIDGLDTHSSRITLISFDGTVLYDSRRDAAELENHAEREEIKEALSTGYGESSRYSDTVLERSLYSAKKLKDGNVLRLSIAQNTVITLVLGMAQPIMIVFLVAIVLSLVLAQRISKSIVKPLNDLNLDDPTANGGYEELKPLLRRIESQQKQLKRQAFQLQARKDEFETIISNMGEGLVLIGSKAEIISINAAAVKLLNTDRHCKGKYILGVSDMPELGATLESALSGKRCEKTVKHGGTVIKLDAGPVMTAGGVGGAVLLLFDVTEQENAEQMRREFTANVSHELKTPLQSISGYSELLANGLVRQEDTADFAGKIYTESRRMVRLVEDIIGLSRLDEGAQDMSREQVDVYDLARDTVSSLEEQAKRAQVTLELTGEKVCINGIPQLISGIIYNLCDNAIKYNVKGGRVCVEIKEQENSAVLTVTDTGIGIPAEHLSRIFERFYRVDKSHSKQVGGTGLGLSIVKHAAKIHGASLSVESEVGKGTTVKVVFCREIIKNDTFEI